MEAGPYGRRHFAGWPAHFVDIGIRATMFASVAGGVNNLVRHLVRQFCVAVIAKAIQLIFIVDVMALSMIFTKGFASRIMSAQLNTSTSSFICPSILAATSPAYGHYWLQNQLVHITIVHLFPKRFCPRRPSSHCFNARPPGSVSS